jgi:MFS family permease
MMDGISEEPCMQRTYSKGGDRQHDGPTTQWHLVWTLILAGVVAAFQIGKAPIAIPLLRQDLGLSLAFASWVVGIYAVVGGIAGLPAGLVINALGARRSLVIGLLVTGAASCAGAFAESGTILLLSRVFEGAGFLMVAIATPTLLGAITADKDQQLVFGFWTVYFATGSVIVMLAGPPLLAFGWQSLWLVTGVAALGYACVIWWTAPVAGRSQIMGGRAFAQLRHIIRSPGPVLLALAFGLYSVQYHALTGLLPTLLVERLGLSISQAGTISAGTIVANGLGAAAAGFLLRKGIALWAVISAGFGCMGAASFGIFHQSMPAAAVAALATASLGITGALAASIYAAAPRFAPKPAMLALTVGMVVQASHLGHVLGPPALGLSVESFGWSSALALFFVIACAGVAAAVAIRAVSATRAN